MAQYCIYCSEMVCGDFNYCRAKDRLYSDTQICHTNNCKDFKLMPIDARGTGNVYKPREAKTGDAASEYSQINFEGLT